MFLQQLLAVVVLASPALPNQVCVSASVPLAPTFWGQTLSINRFDPSLGTLNSVQIVLTASMTGDGGFEWLGTSPHQVSLIALIQVELDRPDLSGITVALPSTVWTDSASAYDGTTDYGGTSGATHTVTNLQLTNTVALTTNADLALFSGPAGNPGTIALPMSCVNYSSAGGVTPFLVYLITLQGGADLTFCYDYTPASTSFCAGDGSATACPCGNSSAVGAGEGCANSLGQGARLAGIGQPSVSNDTLTLSCSGLPATTRVLFFQGTAQQSGGAGSVFGDGLRCVSGTVSRLHVTQAAGGVASYPGPGDAAVSVAGAVPANATRFYQVWYRNAAPFCTPSTFNLSQAVSVMWAP